MFHKHFHPIVVVLKLLLCLDLSFLPNLVAPLKGKIRGILTAVTPKVRVMKKVPHEPDLWYRQAVHHHQLSVEAGVEDLEVGCSRRSYDSKGAEALVTSRLKADPQ